MKYLILGAGTSGLSFANSLLQKGTDDFLVLEKESVAGGLCRSEDVDGTPLDIGGGHFLDVRRPRANNFLFQFMPEDEWNIFDRDSRIVMKNGMVINHPFESNIWQMNEEDQNRYLTSISQAGCNTDKPQPEKFVDWITWKLGDKIAEDYMLPYNMKMFGNELNDLGTYWLNKLPNVSYEDTKKSCELKKPYGIQPGHARFYYPKKFGYGELWKRMADALGKNILYNQNVEELDFDNKTVVANGVTYKADIIITTIPWKSIKRLRGIPQTIKDSIDCLKHSSIQISYYSEHLDTAAQWLYYPDFDLSFHRILVRHNFCPDSKGYWTETNLTRVSDFERKSRATFVMEYAYPLNTYNKPEIIKQLLQFAKNKGVYGLGRWGEHEHYNSDVVVELALNLSDSLEK